MGRHSNRKTKSQGIRRRADRKRQVTSGPAAGISFIISIIDGAVFGRRRWKAPCALGCALKQSTAPGQIDQSILCQSMLTYIHMAKPERRDTKAPGADNWPSFPPVSEPVGASGRCDGNSLEGSRCQINAIPPLRLMEQSSRVFQLTARLLRVNQEPLPQVHRGWILKASWFECSPAACLPCRRVSVILTSV